MPPGQRSSARASQCNKLDRAASIFLLEAVSVKLNLPPRSQRSYSHAERFM